VIRYFGASLYRFSEEIKISASCLLAFALILERMKIWAVSDLHIDYRHNRQWLSDLSNTLYQHDILILAGDISHDLRQIDWCFKVLGQRFKLVCYVPGNHDLWLGSSNPSDLSSFGSATLESLNLEVLGDNNCMASFELNDSLHKWELIRALAEYHGIALNEVCVSSAKGMVSIKPLLSWYDASFARFTSYLQTRWMDFSACLWPSDWFEGLTEAVSERFGEEGLSNQSRELLCLEEQARRVSDYFLLENQKTYTGLQGKIKQSDAVVNISCSHFLPRIDVMPSYIPELHQRVYPVLGCVALDQQVRALSSDIHIYGHSHVNRDESIDGVRYINNAFGAPSEKRIARKRLFCVWDDGAT